MNLASLKALGPPASGPITQPDGEVKMAEAELGVGQGLHELGCGQQSLPGEPTQAVFLNGHLLTMQPLLLVTHVLGELGEGHVGRDNLQGNKHGVNILAVQSGCMHLHLVLFLHKSPLHALLLTQSALLGAPPLTSTPAMKTHSFSPLHF